MAETLDLGMGPEQALQVLNAHDHSVGGVGGLIGETAITDGAISTGKVKNKAITVEKLDDGVLKAISDSPLNPLQACSITYNAAGQPEMVVSEGKTYTMTYDSKKRLNTVSDGLKTIQCQYNEWGQFTGTVIVL